MKQLIIFTDLDGTLLDHDNYSWTPAESALKKIEALDIPLILNTSKTVAEVLDIRSSLENHHPFIIENGGAVCIPSGSPGKGQGDGDFNMHLFGKSYPEILAILNGLKDRHLFNFTGFSDMTATELANLTGLTSENAAMAKRRSCSEPIIWSDSKANFEIFTNQLTLFDLQVISGGRFFHIMGKTDKGAAMSWLLENVYHLKQKQKSVTIALGDSPNDLPMLEQADYSVVINSGSGKSLVLNKIDNVIYTREKGPAGWQIAINELLDQLGD